MRGFAVCVLMAMTMWLAAAAPLRAEAPARLEPAAIRADFRALYAGLQQAHYNLYSHLPKAAYDHLYRRTLTSFDRPLSPMEVRARFQRFVAAGRIAHANIDFPSQEFEAYREAGGRVFPATVSIRNGRTYIETDHSGVAGVAQGDEIVRLDGAPMPTLLARLGRNVSADTDRFRDTLVEMRFRQLLWLELGPRERFDVVLRKPGGRVLTLILPARTRAEAAAAPTTDAGVLALDSENRIARMLDGKVAYLRPGPFYNATPGEGEIDARSFHAFVDRAFTDFIAAGATDLLLDLRQNPGGYDDFSNPMIGWFADRPFRFASDFRIKVSPQAVAWNAARVRADPADTTSAQLAAAYAGVKPGAVIHYPLPMSQPREGERFKGRVWALVDRTSFSNTVSVAAIVQDYRFGKVLGEETADLATTYGALERFILPNSNIEVSFPKAHIIRPNGDLKRAGVVPDIAIETPVIQGADDPVLKAALAVVAKARR